MTALMKLHNPAILEACRVPMTTHQLAQLLQLPNNTTAGLVYRMVKRRELRNLVPGHFGGGIYLRSDIELTADELAGFLDPTRLAELRGDPRRQRGGGRPLKPQLALPRFPDLRALWWGAAA